MPIRQTVRFGLPGWVADPNSVDRHGAGSQINWAAFTNARYGTAGRRKIPSGEPVSWDANGLLIPSDGTGKTGLLTTDANEDSLNAALTGYGVIVGGVIYAAALPVTLTAGQTTALNNHFILQ